MDEPTYKSKHDFITLDSVDSLVLERDPSFIDYLFFHNVLDKFCWLIKLHYADRETVKKKRYRIETLFQWFLLANKVRGEKAKKCLSAQADAERLEFHVTKGWHNELIRNDPLLPDYLQIGTQLSGWAGPGSGGTVAWNVIQSYYSIFEYLSCLATSVNPSLQVEGHKQLAKEFNNHTLGKARHGLLFYPFAISSDTTSSGFPDHPAHCKFHYASYPREPGRSVSELEQEIQKAFLFVGEGRRASLIDFLYQLRLWANYTGVHSLLKLSDGGYQGFLMKNLATIVFFAGGMAEVAVIFSLGEAAYLGMLKRFATGYIDKNERFAKNKYLIPIYIRLRSYKHLGLLSGSIDFIIPESADPVKFIDVQPVAPAAAAKRRR